MQPILNLLFGWIPQAGLILAFFNPDNCAILLEMFQETLRFSKDLSDDLTWDEIYIDCLEYVCNLYDTWAQKKTPPPVVGEFLKGSLFPAVLGFFFGGNK